jgi:hypothetical protein
MKLMASSDNVGLGQLALLLLLMTLSSSSSLALLDEGSGRTSHYMRRLSAGIDLPYTDPLVEALNQLEEFRLSLARYVMHYIVYC